MRKVATSIGLFGLAALCSVKAPAQQIPYLTELLARDEAVNRLLAEKHRAGANLSGFEPIRLRAEAAFKSGNLPGVLETLGEAISALEGKPWDERRKFESSLSLEINRTVIEPNQELQVNLVRMFAADEGKALKAAPTVTIEAAPVDSGSGAPGKRVTLAEHLMVGQSTTIANQKLRLPDGAYNVTATVEAGGEKIAVLRKALYAVGDFSERIENLKASAAQIKNSADARVKAIAGLVATPEFQIQRLVVLNQNGDGGAIDAMAELDRIEAALRALLKGDDPFAADRGEVERAYRSADGQLVPYRVFLPTKYDGKSPLPLIVALHGALGDEQSYFSGLYDPATIKGELERRGYIMAAPNGRSRMSTYTGPGDDDVMQVIRSVTAYYKVDASRIYLTGHSLGGFGTWLIAASHADLFAAIAPVSGGAPVPPGAVPALLAKLKDVLVVVVHGAKDGIVPPDNSRRMVASAKQAGLKVTYIEVPDADHISVVGPSFPSILDFFDKASKQTAAH
ncbi:MAG TPA: prolyl oligopeptidase family serine peptidase [Blastocatellia bacterium]|nr:prolyl oligopeptidase family serine peptidase [Blastocatellia bacterium]